MNYKFDITVTEDEYLQYNTFVNVKSYYGKRKRVGLTAILMIVFLGFSALTLVSKGFSREATMTVCAMAVIVAAFFALFPMFVKSAAKGAIRNGKKIGKPWYTQSAVMEFYDDYFKELTDEIKTEAKYSRIERVSINKDKAVYIHMNMVMGFIIPMSAFESREQYDSFIAFLETKKITIDK